MLLAKKRILGAKIETTTGTAISLSGTNATFNVYDLVANPNIEFIERMGQGSFGRLPSVEGKQAGTFRFKTDLIGGASAPAWMSTFLPACGWVDSTGTFSPKTLPPTDAGGVHTLTLGAYIDGVYKQIHGAMGTWEIELITGQPGFISFDFQGIWDAITDVALVTPTYVTVKPPRFASATLTAGAYSPKVGSVKISSGNVLYLRPDVTASGLFCACVADRKPMVSMDPESDTVANRDTYGIMRALTTAALTCTWGSTGNQLSIAGPSLQIVNAQETSRNGVQADNVDWQCNKSAAGGDDELTLAYA